MAAQYMNSGGAWATDAAAAAEVAEAVKGMAIGADGDEEWENQYEIVPVEVRGDGAPPPADTFEAAGLAEAVLRNVVRCGFESPTLVQRYALPVAVAGRDLMACAQSGSGKTTTFCLPVISGLVNSAAGAGGAGGSGGGRRIRVAKPRAGAEEGAGGSVAMPRALILAPTRELASQIEKEARKFSSETGLRAMAIYGGTPSWDLEWELERGVDILVATPGRLVDMVERSWVSLEAIKYLVIDEADIMLDMGFEHQIRNIVKGMPKKSRQSMLFSATFPPEIQRLASDFLSNYIFITVETVGSSTGLEQTIKFVQDVDKRTFLLDLLQNQSVGVASSKQPLTLIFVETKERADSLSDWLCVKGFPATMIHGGTNQQKREKALRSFESGDTHIMVATDVASRGLDVLNVAHVINYDLPKSIDDYIHRIGRTGRDGKAGIATAFFSESNQPLAKGLLELMTKANHYVPGWLVAYAEMPNYGGSSCYGRKGRRTEGSRYGGRGSEAGSSSCSYPQDSNTASMHIYRTYGHATAKIHSRSSCFVLS